MRPDPVATYRVQLHPGFGFKEMTRILPYLAELGVSHLYTSPYLQAALGSMHGYDVVDPTHVNFQLGSDEDHTEMCETLKKHNLGLMIDIVPNHMAIIGKQNPWWWDVLENGLSSPYSIFFDVDWDASEERWPNKVLLPVLGNHYGRILENGEFKLKFNDGLVVVDYFDQSFPIDPSSLAGFYSRAANACGSEILAFIAESFARLPRPTATSYAALDRRHRDKEVLHKLLVRLCLEKPETLKAIQNEIERLNKDCEALDALLEQQNYRLAFWSTASRDLGYRRFFDIKDLVGLRVEDYEVFIISHALPLRWFKKGWVQGLRVDHPDGLRYPGQYFDRLRETCPDAWIVAEKILEPQEHLPVSWKVDGTTGYEVLNLISGLFIDRNAKLQLTEFYDALIGGYVDFQELVYQCKYLVLQDLFGSEVNLLSNLFVEVCERHRRYRDFSREDLRRTIRVVAACFPVYRTYVSVKENKISEEDKKTIEVATEAAKSKKPELDPELFDFLKEILLLRVEGTLEGEFAMRFQQLTGPVMAKGFEDTALYRYNRLVSLNEVGGSPDHFGTSLTEFHAFCQSARPLSLIATTTHDTKHSEDFRTRLAILSQIPEEWTEAVKSWMSGAIDPNTEYLFFQTIVGAWPIDEERMQSYMEKAIREAKEHTSWVKQNKEYENSVRQFITARMSDAKLMHRVEQFVAKIAPAGRINSLAQTLIKLTIPGIPDLYQGGELWNLSLVDPDNRREVDFEKLTKLLQEIKDWPVEKILSRMEEGVPKMWMIHKVLQLRKTHPFGPYLPLHADDRLVSFMRGDSILVLAPRLPINNLSIPLPEGNWKNIFTNEQVSGNMNFKNFPVALLLKEKA